MINRVLLRGRAFNLPLVVTLRSFASSKNLLQKPPAMSATPPSLFFPVMPCSNRASTASSSQLFMVSPYFDQKKIKERMKLAQLEHNKQIKDPATPPKIPDWALAQAPKKDGAGKIVDPFVPIPVALMPSFLSMQGIRYRWLAFKKGVGSVLSIGLTRKKDPSFKPVPFAVEAQRIFIAVNEALTKGDKVLLRTFVTDDAFLLLTKVRPVTWKFLGELERPRIVHAHTYAMESKANTWTQITVRLHTKQSLSYTSEPGKIKEVLDFVVLERQISNSLNSSWKICGKVNAIHEVPPSLQK